jgi:hypothetical protein
MNEELEKDINAIKNNLSTFGLKLELVYAALVGNEIAKDGGLVAEISGQKGDIKKLGERIEDVNDLLTDRIEDVNDLLTDRIEKVEKDQAKKQLYINLLWGAACFILALIIKSIIK